METSVLVVDQFLAIGDSYTAGIGSNGLADRDEQSGDCRRYKGAYPYIISEDGGWDGINGNSPKTPTLNFGACSGAKMDDLLSNQLNLGEEWRDVSHLHMLSVTHTLMLNLHTLSLAHTITLISPFFQQI